MADQVSKNIAMRLRHGGRVLVTGANGTVGRALLSALLEETQTVRVLVRRADAVTRLVRERVEVVVADVTKPESLRGTCGGVDTVFHLASYSPRAQPGRTDHDTQHWNVTKLGTENLVAEARRAGVRRMVFASSVKSMGTRLDGCADETSVAAPTSGYGKAKLAAEEIVRSLTEIETTILRFTPVYGPLTEGWIPRLISAARRGWLPPLPKVENRSSMIFVNDVAAALILAASHPGAVGRTYILSDGESYSTRAIYESICRVLKQPVPTWGTPLGCFRLASLMADGVGKIVGRRLPLDREAFDTLFGSAWYSNERIRNELGWTPTMNLYDALPEIVATQQVRRAG